MIWIWIILGSIFSFVTGVVFACWMFKNKHWDYPWMHGED